MKINVTVTLLIDAERWNVARGYSAESRGIDADVKHYVGEVIAASGIHRDARAIDYIGTS